MRRPLVLLRFRRERRWCLVKQVRQRYGLRVLNYIVTSNHVHLLVRDREEGNQRVAIAIQPFAEFSEGASWTVLGRSTQRPLRDSHLLMHYLYRLKHG